ncbi:MAG: glycosyltransferase [Acidimicrobiales bacterium]|nr:glycosyltransferase [Acidimicrobiales bacterium]
MTGRLASPALADRPTPSRFALVGLLATAIDLGLVVLLTEADVDRWLADLIALGVAAPASYVLHRRVTLRGDRLDRWIRQPPVFATVAVLAGLVDLLVFTLVTSPAVFPAKLLAIGAAAVIRTVGHRLVLFRAVRRDQDQPSGRPPAEGDHRLSVVVPAFHEETRIADTVARIRSELGKLDQAGDLEIVVVDDGSSDDTAAVARSAGADQVIVQPENRGKGAAVRAGVLVARGRTVAFTDADLAYAPGQLVPMLDAVESGYDVVVGNRHDNDSDTLVGTSALRSFGSRVVNMATNILLLGNYRDTQCGCKAFRSDIGRVVLGAGKIDGFAFDIEILHLIERYGLSLKEVPVEVVNSETSTVRALHDGLAVGRDILRIRRNATQGVYPSLSADALPTGS